MITVAPPYKLEGDDIPDQIRLLKQETAIKLYTQTRVYYKGCLFQITNQNRINSPSLYRVMGTKNGRYTVQFIEQEGSFPILNTRLRRLSNPDIQQLVRTASNQWWRDLMVMREYHEEEARKRAEILEASLKRQQEAKKTAQGILASTPIYITSQSRWPSTAADRLHSGQIEYSVEAAADLLRAGERIPRRNDEIVPVPDEDAPF